MLWPKTFEKNMFKRESFKLEAILSCLNLERCFFKTILKWTQHKRDLIGSVKKENALEKYDPMKSFVSLFLVNHFFFLYRRMKWGSVAWKIIINFLLWNLHLQTRGNTSTSELLQVFINRLKVTLVLPDQVGAQITQATVNHSIPTGRTSSAAELQNSQKVSQQSFSRTRHCKGQSCSRQPYFKCS